MLPGKLGMKPSILLLTIGYALGYAMMGLSGAVAVLALGFFLVGIAKGSVINTAPSSSATTPLTAPGA